MAGTCDHLSSVSPST